MAKTVRVDMNIDQPELTLKNAKKAVAKHTAMGAGSPLTGFVDMTAFGTKTNDATTLRQNADAQRIIFEEKYNDAEMLAGTGAGQTKNSVNTIYYGVVQVRDILLVKHRGTEEALEGYGFNVVITQTGARKNVRVDIPDELPSKMIELGQAIVAKHTALGVGSPFTGNIDMTAFGTLVTDAADFLEDWEAAKDEAQTLNNEAIMIIGYGAGQTKDTVGTIYYDRCSIRDRLLQKYQGTEEKLTAFGFDVVISEHDAGGKKGAGKTTVIQLDIASGAIVDINTIAINPTAETMVGIEVSGSNAALSAAANPGPVMGPVIWTLPAGTTTEKTFVQFTVHIGADAAHPHLKAENQGPSVTHLKLTFTKLAEE